MKPFRDILYKEGGIFVLVGTMPISEIFIFYQMDTETDIEMDIDTDMDTGQWYGHGHGHGHRH